MCGILPEGATGLSGGIGQPRRTPKLAWMLMRLRACESARWQYGHLTLREAFEYAKLNDPRSLKWIQKRLGCKLCCGARGCRSCRVDANNFRNYARIALNVWFTGKPQYALWTSLEEVPAEIVEAFDGYED